MTFTVAKINDKIVEIIKFSETVHFSKEKNWLLISSQVNKRLSLKWIKSETRFDWVKTFTF